MSKKPPAKSPPNKQVVHQAWSGPLPAPSQLEHFNEVVPGAAERIIRMAEQEGEHSRQVQLIAVKAASRAQLIGQIFALAIAGGGLVAAYFLAMAGHDAVAVVVAGTTITTVVAAFLQARKAAKAV